MTRNGGKMGIFKVTIRLGESDFTMGTGEDNKQLGLFLEAQIFGQKNEGKTFLQRNSC